MFAVIKTGGKQYKVAEKDILVKEMPVTALSFPMCLWLGPIAIWKSVPRW